VHTAIVASILNQLMKALGMTTEKGTLVKLDRLVERLLLCPVPVVCDSGNQDIRSTAVACSEGESEFRLAFNIVTDSTIIHYT
jgi:hypothetical protein